MTPPTIVPMEPPKLLTLGERTLKVAIAELGNGELGGNNGGQDVAKYKGLTLEPGNLGAWCASFLSWCMMRAADAMDPLDIGVDRWLKKRNGAKALYRMIGRAGSFVDEPEAGDVVCWDRGKRGSWQGHIGIVEGCENGIIATIEGNKGRYPSLVRRFEHDLDLPSRMIGFARMP